MATDDKRASPPLRHGFPPLPPRLTDPLDVPRASARALPVAAPESDVEDLHDDDSADEEHIVYTNPQAAPARPSAAADLSPPQARPSAAADLSPTPAPDPEAIAAPKAEVAAAKGAPPAPKAKTEEPARASRRATRPDGHSLPPAPAKTDPRELARKLAEEARQRAAAQPAEPPPAAPTPTASEAPKKKSLADRTAKRITVEDALKAAAHEPEPSPAPPAKPAAAPPAPAPAAAPAAPIRPTVAPEAIIVKSFTGAIVVRAVVVANGAVFRALWTAHRARANATGDVTLLVAAAALLDAADRVPADCLAGVHVTYRGDDWVIWVDLARGAVLAATPQPDLYLAGL